MTDKELSCKELVDIVTDYIEGHLTPADSATFRTHIADCPGCSTYLDQMRLTMRALGRVPSPPIPQEMKTRLMAAFRDRQRG